MSWIRWNNANVSAISSAASKLGNTANALVNNTMPPNLVPNVLPSVLTTLNAGILGAPQATTQAMALNQANQQALDNGWLFAGSYYFAIISNMNNYSYPPPQVIQCNSRIGTKRMGINGCSTNTTC